MTRSIVYETPTNPIYHKVIIRSVLPGEENLEAYDHTMLSAAATCPTWGILRYQENKVMPGNGRALALEAGSASHEFYAATRLASIRKSHPEHFKYHLARNFEPHRIAAMMPHLDSTDEPTANLNFALEALYTSGFYDDPDDNKRTMTNIEEAAIAFNDRFDHAPVWIQDEANPKSMIGVEIGLDAIVEYHVRTPYFKIAGDGMEYEVDIIKWRHIGRIDGVHIRNNRPILDENKTASRMDNAWRQSFEMSHQVTGYIATSQIIEGLQDVSEAHIWGAQLPQPRRSIYEGIVREPVTRYPHQIEAWLWWQYDMVVNYYHRFKNNPYQATRFTHSCNRYFRPCSFIPFCVADRDEQELIVSEMEHNHWSPLETDVPAED